MPTYFLPIFRSNAFLELTERIGTIQGAGVRLETILNFCKLYRIQGICGLFLEGRPDSFITDLHKSGGAFLYFLQHAGEEIKATSKAAPFFDAVASGDLNCARAIAQNSRLTWNPEEEFEDDYCYVLFLLKHFFLGASPVECTSILQRFEKILEGAADPHFDICQAFAANDPELFSKSLQEFLEGYQRRYQNLLNKELVSPEEAETERKLSVEGLALVRLAQSKGFPLDEDYLLIPSTAREKVSVVFTADGWKSP